MKNPYNQIVTKILTLIKARIPQEIASQPRVKNEGKGHWKSKVHWKK